MLFDPKWAAPGPAHFLAWLETKDPNETYYWANPRICLMGQYREFCGLEHSDKTYEKTRNSVFENLDDASTVLMGEDCNGERTFGAALERARKVLA